MIAQPIQTKQLSADGFCWNQYSERVGSITNEFRRHFAPVTYFAFDSWDEAHNFWKAIVGKHCTRALVRESERFTSQPWKVKTWNMRQGVLEKLIERDHQRQTKSLPLPPIRRDWSLSESYDAISLEAA